MSKELSYKVDLLTGTKYYPFKFSRKPFVSKKKVTIEDTEEIKCEQCNEVYQKQFKYKHEMKNSHKYANNMFAEN